MKFKLFIVTTLFLNISFLDNTKAQFFNTFYLTAHNQFENRNYQEAIDFATKAINSKQSAEKAKFIRAKAYYELALYTKAKEDIVDIVDNNIDSNKYILSLKILDKLGLYKELKEKSLIYFEKCKSNTVFIFYVKSCIQEREYNLLLENIDLHKNNFESKGLAYINYYQAVAYDSLKNIYKAIVYYEKSIFETQQLKEINQELLERNYLALSIDNLIIRKFELAYNHLKNYLSVSKDKQLTISNKLIENSLPSLISSIDIDLVSGEYQIQKIEKALSVIFDCALTTNENVNIELTIKLIFKYANSLSLSFIEGKKYEYHLYKKQYYDAYKALANTMNPSKIANLSYVFSLLKSENLIVAKPTIKFKTIKNREIKYFSSITMVPISFSIIDTALIYSIKINGVEQIFDKSELNPKIFTEVSFEKEIKNIEIDVTNAYGKTRFYSTPIEDKEPPKIEILYPANLMQSEYIPERNTDETAYMEFKISDANFIKEYSLNSNSVNNSDTSGSILIQRRINIKDIDTIKLVAIDENLNKGFLNLYINRKKSIENQKNPMGKTWFVFIENSEYKEFNELEGAKQDAAYIKSALSNYQIDSVIHLRNLKLADMKKFFDYDLNKLIQKNQLKSVGIWYAGHGKFSEKENKGYWIPADAERENFDSFFSLTELKIYLANLRKLQHLLIISDACETGQSFYTKKIMRGVSDNCGDNIFNYFSSNECFTSSDKEKSSDNSLFARTFNNVLQKNNDECITISKVSELVSSIIIKNQNQKPIYGKITGLEDENGTFIFFRRKNK